MSEFNVSKIRKLDGGLLLIFRELIECGNASTTAARLNLSPSAISHSIARMRVLFDDPLFIRKSHGLEPTIRALELHIQVNKILGLAESLVSSPREFDPANDQRLFRVAAPEYVTALLGASLVTTFAISAPSISIMYEHVPPETAVERLRRGDIDIALGRFDTNLPDNLKRLDLYEDSFCVAARKSHPRVKGRLTQQQYESERHVLASARSEVTAKEKTTAPIMPSGVIVGQWLTALTIASETDSLATCHRRLAERHAKLLKLQILAPPFQPYKFSISCIYRKDPHPALTWLVEQISAQLG